MLSNLKNPPKLQKGDTVAIVAPSSGLAGLFPHRLEKGVEMLKKMGFEVLVSEHAREKNGWVSASPQDRAADLHSMFLNPSVKAVICSIGGNHANQLLKYLDFELIKNNPKIFLGYSDITVLHYAITSHAQLRTFYGPCVVSEFGEFPEILSYTREYFEKALMKNEPMGEITISEEWTDEFLDWFEKRDLERPRIMNISSGYEWWRAGSTQAPIWGGAVPSLNHLVGTEYWVDPTDTIFFVDIPEGDPGKPHSQSELDSFFADLDNLGVFSSIKGLIIGRPYGYGEKEYKNLKQIIQYYTESYNYPILCNANIGHASPIITVPLGINVLLDSTQNKFVIIESGVE